MAQSSPMPAAIPFPRVARLRMREMSSFSARGTVAQSYTKAGRLGHVEIWYEFRHYRWATAADSHPSNKPLRLVSVASSSRVATPQTLPDCLYTAEVYCW